MLTKNLAVKNEFWKNPSVFPSIKEIVEKPLQVSITAFLDIQT